MNPPTTQHKNKCHKCHGCGQVATDDEQTPWIFWEELPRGSDLAVQLGMVSPVTCPACGGSGKETTEMDMNEFLIEAHRRLDAATVEDGLGKPAACMYQLGALHGLLIKLIETEKQKEPEPNTQKENTT